MTHLPRPRSGTHHGVLASLLIAACLLIVVATPSVAGAQYGGVSGLFVTTSPDTPGMADFTGLGCEGGVEVVLYLPGSQPTSSDPSSGQTVPGRVLEVTTSVDRPGSLENGTFAFPDVELPTDLEAGTYRVLSRCGDLDLEVLIHISSDGSVTFEPNSNAPVLNEIPEALPFTGRNSSRMVSFAAGLVAMGVSLAAFARRPAVSTRR